MNIESLKDEKENNIVLMNDIIELCKRRGFIFHSSELYGGLKGVYDYGPLGVELKNNLKKSWWRDMVHLRDDIEGLDSSILTHKNTLKNSQHLSKFNDEIFKCNFGQEKDNVYLRPETAQGIFLNFKNVISSMNKKLPFGIAQIGKSFRNETTTRNFIFRTREFEQMEIEFFVFEGTDEEWHKKWIDNRFSWWINQGLSEKNLSIYFQQKDELSHYAKSTCDILYNFPNGRLELEGISNRSNFDLISHYNNEDSNEKINIKNKNGENTIPFVIEPSAGIDRGILALLTEAYTKEKLSDGTFRIVLKIKPHLSPYKVAVIPLARNNDKIVKKSKEIVNILNKINIGVVKYEDCGNIGKSYRRHDEIGTPFCITVDFETFEGISETVTIRDRDTMDQKRIKIEDLHSYF